MLYFHGSIGLGRLNFELFYIPRIRLQPVCIGYRVQEGLQARRGHKAGNLRSRHSRQDLTHWLHYLRGRGPRNGKVGVLSAQSLMYPCRKKWQRFLARAKLIRSHEFRENEYSLQPYDLVAPRCRFTLPSIASLIRCRLSWPRFTRLSSVAL